MGVARPRLSVVLAVLLQLLQPAEHTGLSQETLHRKRPKAQRKEYVMGMILVLLILALIFGGLGFAIHALWIVAVVLLIVWAVMFALGRGRSHGARV
jgi:predicted RND superfamily exporter protein